MSKGPKAKPKKTGKAGKAKAKPKAVKTKATAAATPAPEAAAPEAAVQEPPAPEMEDAPRPKTPAREEARTGGVKRMLGLAAFVAVLVGVFYMSWPLWSHIIAPYISGLQSQTQDTPAAGAPAEAPPGNETSLQELKSERQQMKEELNRLMARMESIESSVESVKKMIRATAGEVGETGKGSNLRALSERLNDLEKSGESVKSLLHRMDQFEKDGGQLNAAGASDGASARALVLAVANLRQAISRDAPFEKSLEALKAVGGENPDIKTAAALLAKTARTGIPTLSTLRDRFELLAGRIVSASKTLEERGWMERAANRVSSLVTWRRVDEKSDSVSIDAIVARAEARLREGDLQAAVKSLEGLSANAQGDTKANTKANARALAQAAPWLKDAKARVVAERAVATLHVYAISLLAPVKE
ncbi:MAG: mitofilin family membrane protein [Rhodospirillales bacterium]